MTNKEPLVGLTIGCYHDLNEEIFAQEGINYNKRETEFVQNYLDKIVNPSKYKTEVSGNIPTISHHVHVSSPASAKKPNQVSINKTILTINRLNDLGIQWQHFMWTNNPDTIPDNIKNLKNVIIKDIREFEDHKLYHNILQLFAQAQEDERALAGISDLVRYLASYKFGGPYFDGDYELFDAKKLYELMQVYNIIVGKEPKELSGYIGSSFFASKPNHLVLEAAIKLIERNLNQNFTSLPEYLRYPCALFSKRMYEIGPAMLTIAVYNSANASNNDLVAMDGSIFFNKKYIDYITPNTSCYKPNPPVDPINYIDGYKINTIGADTWCHVWPSNYFDCIYYPEKLDTYLYGATLGNNINKMQRYLEEGANPDYIYKNDTALALALRNKNIPAIRLLVNANAIVDDKIKQLANATSDYRIINSLSKFSKLAEIGCYANHTEIIFAQEGYNYLAEDEKIKEHYKLFAPSKLSQENLPFRIPARMVKIYVTSFMEPKPIDNISLNKTITTLTRLNQEDDSWVFDFYTNNIEIISSSITNIPGVKVHHINELRQIDPYFWDNIMVRLLLKAESEKYFYAEFSDIIRVMALTKGGFYQDLDGEIYRPEAFSALRKYNFVGGKELSYKLTYIGNAFFGASENHPIIRDTFALIKRNLLTEKSLLPEYLQFPCNIGCKIIYDTGSPTLTTSYFKNANQNGNIDIIFPNKVFFNRDYARYLTPESRCHDPKAIAYLDNEVDGELVESIAGDPFCGSWGIGALNPIYYPENKNHHLYESARLGDLETLKKAILDKADINQPDLTSGITPLNIAAHNGHYKIVEELLKNGANTELQSSGSTALLWAVSKGHANIVNLLLDYNADINAVRPNNSSALFIASYNRSPEIVRILLARGAKKDILLEGNTAESYARQNNFTEIVQIFDNNKPLSPELALSMAVARGDYYEVKKLLDAGVDKEKTIGEFTALQTAAFYEQEEIVDLLLERGARIVSEGNFSALNIAQVKQVHTEKGTVIYNKILESYLNSSIFNKVQFVIARYNESLKWALKELPNEDVIVYNKGPNDLDYLPDNFKIINLPNIGRESHTYLYHIITNYNGTEDIVLLQGDPYEHPLLLPLIRFKYERPSGCNNIIARCTKIQPTLFEKSLDLEKQLARNFKNYTAKYTLTEFVHLNIDPFYDVNSTLLMVNGAQFAVSRKNIWNHPLSYYQKLLSFVSSDNPLEGYYFERIWDLVFAPTTNYVKTVTQELIDFINKHASLDAIVKLLSQEVDVNYKDKDGLNALHRATLNNRTDLIPLMLLKGFDINSVTDGNNNIAALHICALNNFLEACRILITSGADVNLPAKNGYPPLNQAISKNHTEIVSLLIKYGAEVVNDRFMNPLELAARLENDYLHELLLAKYHENLKALDLKNKLNCPVTNISVVVVTVNEDISWIPDEFPCHDVTVYNKGKRNLTDTPYYKVKKVENIGYFEGQEMKHIVENYNNLSPRTLFLQGNPYDAYIFPYFYRFAEDLNSTCHNIICKCDTAPHNLQAESAAMQEFDWVTGVHGKYKNFNYQNNNLEAFAKKYLDVEIPYLFPICYASLYAVDKEVVYRHSLEYYQNLSESINYRQYPIEGFYFKRLNDLIYAEPLGKNMSIEV